MPEYSRVKDKSTGHKFTVIASAVDEDAMQVLKQDAVDVVGEPLPPEYAHESLSSESTGQKANTTEKEKAR